LIALCGAYYIEADYKKTLDVILPICDTYQLAALYCFAGFAFSKLRQDAEAKKILIDGNRKSPNELRGLL
jgi:hypothetical protein